MLDRTLHFADAAMKKKDNNLLRFVSTQPGTNASFDPLEKTITLEGVDNFYLHARPKVAVLPKNKQVVLRENRGLDFAGKIFAGLSVLEGRGFHFDYDKFQVSLDSLETLDLYYPTGGTDANGQPNASAIDSRIERTGGILLVNAPANDDGRIYLWLKSANGHHYYFNYKKGILHVYSNNEQFNRAVEALKEKDRLIEVKKGMTYELQLTTPDLVTHFIKRAGLN